MNLETSGEITNLYHQFFIYKQSSSASYRESSRKMSTQCRSLLAMKLGLVIMNLKVTTGVNVYGRLLLLLLRSCMRLLGTIGLTLAHRVGMVMLTNPLYEITYAHRNAEINGLKNCKFVCAELMMRRAYRQHYLGEFLAELLSHKLLS